MHVCLKCGWEITYGGPGCACVQAARREREEAERQELSEKIAKELTPDVMRKLARVAKRAAKK